MPPTLRLYAVHGSHPCAAVERALELKGLEYRLLEWPPPLHAVLQPLLFGARTVPAIKRGSEKLVGSRRIMHRLDELAPEPRLYPEDPALRQRVEQADLWGDEQFQQVARDLIWAGLTRRPAALVGYSRDAQLKLPAPAVRLIAPIVARGAARLNRTSPAKARARLEALPAQLDRIDAWIADGTIGDPAHPNAADLQLLSTVRLLYSMADVRQILERRPCLVAAQALWPPILGELPAGAIG